jgi:amino-acid N-acetyltransferase
MSVQSEQAGFVRWFRDSSPYIHAHRGRTFVISFGGETVDDGRFGSLANDFALLNSLGVRLVLVHGVRPQVERRLTARGAELRYENGLRITDAVALECVKEAAGSVRVEIEALLSMGLPNSPMAGAGIRVASGNFVVAKPLGVRDGVDFGHTGEVRRIDVEALRSKLNRGEVLLVSPLGYSLTGEVFNLSAEEVATALAVALGADKLLLLMEQKCQSPPESGELLRQLTTLEATRLIETPDALGSDVIPHLRAAVSASGRGVKRVHLLDRHVDGAILLELFTRDGVGTLVSDLNFEEMRPASIDDIGGIIDLIRPLEQKGLLVKRSREHLEMEIGDYIVIERDGMILGCAALHGFPDAGMGELACLALHPAYQGGQRGAKLLAYMEAKAREGGLKVLFVLTTQTAHWFREQGFDLAETDDLPMARRALYNFRRNSKVLIKKLDKP